MKQTAVEWFASNINEYTTKDEFYMLFEQAKQMEKEQMKESFDSARKYIHTTVFKYEDAKQYYEETYGEKTGQRQIRSSEMGNRLKMDMGTYINGRIQRSSSKCEPRELQSKGQDLNRAKLC